MVNSRKHAAIALGLLGNFALGVGGCSGSASLGGGSSSVGGGQSGGVAATGAVIVYLAEATAELVSPLYVQSTSRTEEAVTEIAPVYFVEEVVGVVPVVPAVRV